MDVYESTVGVDGFSSIFLGLPHFGVAMSQNLVTPNGTHSDSWLLDVDVDPLAHLGE